MNNRQKFKRAVIESIHGVDYEEAIAIENEELQKNTIAYYAQLCHFPITIGRVMATLPTDILYDRRPYKENETALFIYNAPHNDNKIDGFYLHAWWKLTKENGQEADDDFQSDETIDKLLTLLTK